MKHADKVHGIVVPMLTPLNEDETLCLESLPALVDHIAAGKAHGIFQISTTGEYARLSRPDRFMLAERTINLARGKTAVYLGVSDVSTRQAVANAKQMAGLSPDYLVCSLPFYFPARDGREIVSFFNEVAAATDLPLVLYNIPVTCGASITIDALDELIRNEKIVAIKDSSGDLEYFAKLMELKKKRPGFSVLSGDECVMPDCARMGCDGYVPSLANVFPDMLVAYYNFTVQKENEKAAGIYNTIKKMNELNVYSDSWMSAIAWRKEALFQMGVMPAHMTKPSVLLDEATKARVGEILSTAKAI